MIILYCYVRIKPLILSTRTEFPVRSKKTRKGIKPYLSHFFLSKQWKSFLHCAHWDFLQLDSPCQGRWGGPWKTLWRLVVGGSQGVWWPFHYSRSLPFHACPSPPSFPAEHLHRKGNTLEKVRQRNSLSVGWTANSTSQKYILLTKAREEKKYYPVGLTIIKCSESCRVPVLL